jgi:hypothetical protein
MLDDDVKRKRTDSKLLDGYLLKGFYDKKLASSTMHCYEIELPPHKQLIKSAAELVLTDKEVIKRSYINYTII